MPHVVTNGLKREIGIDQPLNTGVSKRVSSWPMDLHAGFMKVKGDARGYRPVADRLVGSKRPEKQVAVLRLGPTALEIINQRPGDNTGQRVGR
jgi:hypothetical protein